MNALQTIGILTFILGISIIDHSELTKKNQIISYVFVVGGAALMCIGIN